MKNFIRILFQSYIIDSDFLIDYDIKDELHKLEDESEYKCYPKKGSNKTPYQKIEIEIRKDAPYWPPITKSSDHDSNHIPNGKPNHIEVNEKPKNNRTISGTKNNSSEEFEMIAEKVTVVPLDNECEKLNVELTKI